MKMSKKVSAALDRRRKDFNGKGPNQQNKHVAHLPGSQNRKKGYGMKRSGR
jgi:hypothetical protein